MEKRRRRGRRVEEIKEMVIEEIREMRVEEIEELIIEEIMREERKEMKKEMKAEEMKPGDMKEESVMIEVEEVAEMEGVIETKDLKEMKEVTRGVEDMKNAEEEMKEMIEGMKDMIEGMKEMIEGMIEIVEGMKEMIEETTEMIEDTKEPIEVEEVEETEEMCQENNQMPGMTEEMPVKKVREKRKEGCVRGIWTIDPQETPEELHCLHIPRDLKRYNVSEGIRERCHHSRASIYVVGRREMSGFPCHHHRCPRHRARCLGNRTVHGKLQGAAKEVLREAIAAGSGQDQITIVVGSGRTAIERSGRLINIHCIIDN